MAPPFTTIEEQLNVLSSFLRIPPTSVTINESQVPEFHQGNNVITGLSATATYLLQTALPDLSTEEKAAIKQWFEYRMNYVDRINNDKQLENVLQELNTYLVSRVFLVKNSISAADVFLYLGLYPIMKTMSYQDKEKNINVSRWFNTIQHSNGFSSAAYPALSFSRSLLYYVN